MEKIYKEAHRDTVIVLITTVIASLAKIFLGNEEVTHSIENYKSFGAGISVVYLVAFFYFYFFVYFKPYEKDQNQIDWRSITRTKSYP